MKIDPTFFVKGKQREVDFGLTGDWHDRYRISLRSAGDTFEVYEQHFYTQHEKVLYRGSLRQCVDFCNSRFGYHDEVIESAE